MTVMQHPILPREAAGLETISNRGLRQRARAGRMPSWQRYATETMLALCMSSGLVFFLKQHEFLTRTGLDAHTWLVLHGVTAMGAVLLFGAALPAHVVAAWRAQRHRRSGLAMLVCLGALVATGCVLYYGSESIREAGVSAHELLGWAALVLVPVHVVQARRCRVGEG